MEESVASSRSHCLAARAVGTDPLASSLFLLVWSCSAPKLARFKFQTRLHYCARDASTAGEGSGWSWGEHEMDYILLIRTDDPVDLIPNPEEVDNHKYVTQDELREMMRDEDLLWSPWFRIIEKEFLHTW